MDLQLNYILVKNEYGKNAWQLIITKWVNESSAQDAILAAKELADQLRKQGLTVVRTKVEHEVNVLPPQYMLRKDEYFEFHIKIKVTSGAQYQQLKKLGKSHNVIWSTLVQSKTNEFTPISTLRIKAGSLDKAMWAKDTWIAQLKAQDVTLGAKMHQELCVYDDNESFDLGWEGPQ